MHGGGLVCPRKVGQTPVHPCGPRPPGSFPNNGQQEVPLKQTGVLASPTARPGKHRPRSPSQQQWRIVAATAQPAEWQAYLDKHRGGIHY